MLQNQFAEIAGMIRASRQEALKTVNTTLIDLYWNIGRYIHIRIERSEWGKSIVEELARYFQQKDPGLKGFSVKSIRAVPEKFFLLVEYILQNRYFYVVL